MNRQHLLRLGIPLALSLVMACDGKVVGGGESDTSDVTTDTYVPADDADGDGWTELTGDCDDSNADIHPSQTESCNGTDDNCNGVVDEGFSDTDIDGTPDCLDTEDCDGADNDGDGAIDEDYPDLDGNGIPDCRETEICDGIDNDGNGTIDEGFDADSDGYSGCDADGHGAEDCNDDDSTINPGTTEVASNLVDDDCDGLIDEGAWASGELIINEIMNNPGGVNDPEGEWFEVWNASDHALILNGLVLSSTVDGDWHQVRADDLLIIEPGEYFVLGTNDNLATNGQVEVDYVYDHDEYNLSNETDGLLIEADGITLDLVEWDDGASFPDPVGASMSLDPAAMDISLNDSGEFWCPGKVQWSSATGSDLGSPGRENSFCWPTAVASYDPSSSLLTCDTLQLDGSGSVDSDGLSLTYEWELTSAPAGSALTSSDIEEVEDMSPTFVPDVAGTYVFTLTVYNGDEYSQPSSVSIDISERSFNNDPTPDAGSDQTYSATADCTPISYGASYDCDACSDYEFSLDGTASSDPDGDEISDPVWTITSGASDATIDDEDTWEPTVTITGQTPSYGVTTTTTVEVQLQVTDCMGAVGTDTVTLNYECTGD